MCMRTKAILLFREGNSVLFRIKKKYIEKILGWQLRDVALDNKKVFRYLKSINYKGKSIPISIDDKY